MPNNKTLDADDVLNSSGMVANVCDSVENFVGKGENAGYQHFLHFPKGLQWALSTGLLIKAGIS